MTTEQTDTERAAFVESYVRVGPKIRGVAFSLGLNKIDPMGDEDDLLQEAALNILQSGRDPSKLNDQYWITAARRKAIDGHRRRTNPAAGQVSLFEFEDSDLPSPEDPIGDYQQRSDLRTALGQISPKERRAIILNTVYGLRLNEVASVMETTLNVVKKLRQRGFNNLRRAMKQ